MVERVIGKYKAAALLWLDALVWQRWMCCGSCLGRCTYIAKRVAKAGVGTSVCPWLGLDCWRGMREGGKAVLLPLKVSRWESRDSKKRRWQHREFLQKFWQHIVLRSIQLGGGKRLLLSCNTSTGSYKACTHLRMPALLDARRKFPPSSSETLERNQHSQLVINYHRQKKIILKSLKPF